MEMECKFLLHRHSAAGAVQNVVPHLRAHLLQPPLPGFFCTSPSG